MPIIAFCFSLYTPFVFVVNMCLCDYDYEYVCVYLFLEKVLSVLQSPQMVLLVFMFHLVTRWLEVPN